MGHFILWDIRATKRWLRWSHNLQCDFIKVEMVNPVGQCHEIKVDPIGVECR